MRLAKFLQIAAVPLVVVAGYCAFHILNPPLTPTVLAQRTEDAYRDVVRAWLDAEHPRSPGHDAISYFTQLTSHIASRTTLGLCPGTGQFEIAANLLKGRVGQCGDCSALLKTCAEVLGYQARYVNLYNIPTIGDGHTMVEIWLDGAWRLFDPTLALIWRDERGRVLSFGYLRKQPHLADSRRVRLTTLGTASNSDSLAYASTDAFREADPAGPVSPTSPTTFHFDVIPLSPDEQGRVWHIGEPDGSSGDMVTTDPARPIPVGLTSIGGVVANHWHTFRFSDLRPGERYELRLRTFDCTPSFTARVMRPLGLTVIGGWSHTFVEVGVDPLWSIAFEAITPTASLTIGHVMADVRAWAALDCIDLRLSDSTLVAGLASGRQPPPLRLPKQTTPSLAEPDGLGIARIMVDGVLVYSPYVVALQAMRGKTLNTTDKASASSLGNDHGLIPLLEETISIDDQAVRSLQWLIDNAWTLEDNSLVWHYEFDNSYNNVVTSSPWPSAFGQAYVIRALLAHRRHRGDDSLREYIERACMAYAVPIDRHGLASRLSDGNWFYQEVPAEPSPHILNGHLVATLTLTEAAIEINSPEVRSLAERGLATIRAVLPRFDVGYWSRYDLNPRNSEWLLQVQPADAQSTIGIGRVSLISPANGDRRDILAGDHAFVGASRFVGVDWTAHRTSGGRPYVEAEFGPALHCAPPPGGTRQNTYLCFETPNTDVADWYDQTHLVLEIEYIDLGPGHIYFQSQSIAHGESLHFVPLPGVSISLTSDGKWHTARVPIGPEHFAWHVGTEYQLFHIRLLERLYALTQDKIFDDYAKRWRSFLVARPPPPARMP